MRLLQVLLAGTLAGLPAAEAQRARKKMPAVAIGNPGDWISPDDYPPDALRMERQGRVVAEIGVDSGGKAVSCSISQSSGTTSLDQKTCELALARGRFDPATDGRGRPVASTYKLPVSWLLPEETIDKAGLRVMDIGEAKIAYEVEQTIGIDGTVEACRIVSRSDNVPDLCQQMPIGSKAKMRYTAAGEPVRVVIRLRFSGEAEPVKAGR